ncbi:MAG: hypothetical protein JO057_07880, partial [Chloroflexi bacterium]|nr:hypothetical protein [Chloroflexota bacterium]
MFDMGQLLESKHAYVTEFVTRVHRPRRAHPVVGWYDPTEEDTFDMSTSEAELQVLQRLGIQSPPAYLLIMDQAAHMDWDWLYTFQQYFAGTGNSLYTAVQTILSDALALLSSDSKSPSPGPAYYYSLCEMGFFKQFVETQTAQGVDVIAQIRAAGNYLRIVGGGITSPDCLVCSGEGFLRNYLLGKLWLASLFPELLPLKHCWIPDDFGQDPELPIAVQALGMTSISFSRLPGITPGSQHETGISNTELAKQMLNGAVDFWWTASDQASKVFTHWMPGGQIAGEGYSQGGGLATDVESTIQAFLAFYNENFTKSTPPFSGAPTRYLYMPIDQDFMDPLAGLLGYVNTWNTSASTGGVVAVEASYDDFVALVLASGQPLQSLAYNGTAYWMGYYASRPALKILHYASTRQLLAAEVFGLLAFGQDPASNASYWQQIGEAWNNFAPSTHHDYISGTSVDQVVQTEQLALLNTTYSAAQALTTAALEALAASTCTQDGQVLLANPTSVAFQGLIELAAPAPPNVSSIVVDGTPTAAQATSEGGLVFTAQVPGLGYTVGTLSPNAAKTPAPPSISPETSGATEYTLKNEFLTVVVSAGSNWGISSLTDRQGNSLLKPGQTGNDLVFYTDPGNIYQFASELPEYAAKFVPATLDVHTTAAGLGASVLESGPVRVRLQTTVSISCESLPSQDFVREYCLVAGEPFLRMSMTGAPPSVSAPQGYSIMTAFPLAEAVETIVHGTACHWTAAQPHPFYAPPLFQATHHFLLAAAADGSQLGAIYHPEVPCWGIDSKGLLLGCLLRNTPNSGRGAAGSDTCTNTLHYALRIPDGLRTPDSGQPLAEALAYVAPAVAQRPTRTTPGASSTGFVASVSAPGVIQAAKPSDVVPGTLILRLYQPSNAPRTLTVTLGGGRPTSVQAVTALEDPLTDNA